MPSLPSHEASLDRHLDRVCEHARANGLSPLFEAAFKTDDVIRALGAMVRLYDNPESATEEYAATAAREGRPAYWTTATYHNQTARLVVEHANRESLRYAVERFADDEFPVIARHTMILLNDLIPLNTRAIREIAEFRASAALNLLLRMKRKYEAMIEGARAVGRAMDRIAS